MKLFTTSKDLSPSLRFCFTEIPNELIYEIYVWPVESAHIIFFFLGGDAHSSARMIPQILLHPIIIRITIKIWVTEKYVFFTKIGKYFFSKKINKNKFRNCCGLRKWAEIENKSSKSEETNNK